MPIVHPFRAFQYLHGKGDVSSFVAPPYDVLDAAGRSALLAKSPSNAVAIDLPHTPAKELGPPAAYEGAAATYRKWGADGVLSRSQPAIFAYRQTTNSGSGTSRRCGMAACLDVVPFGPREGGGILAHEETFSGPKEDRMALMKATHAQLSPIFGLHADEAGTATALVHSIMAQRPADLRADMGDGVLHEVWTVSDAATIKAYQDSLRGEDIFIADGHHRYTTQINYLKGLEGAGTVPADHPARRCMMVLVGMSDPGLIIWPTHRVLGGMKGYSIDAFVVAASNHLVLEPQSGGLADLERALEKATGMGEMRFGVHDFASGRQFIARPKSADPLAGRFPDKPAAWRKLVVAFLQYSVVEEVCQKALNGGEAVKWAFPHTIPEVSHIGSGVETGAGGGKGFAQLALIVRPTPLDAVKDVSRANQLMPQKSTFFYPKLATGLFFNPLD